MRPVLVFDMDGVLVDVSASYRESIRETVRHFTGTVVSPEAVQDYKNQGGWNNDWALSQRLCVDLGVDVPYDTVVQTFQRIFLGTNNDGLLLREKWLPSDGLFARLSQTHELTIFTGRPRAEAVLTLTRFAPGVHWSVVIADEDVANPKPAPDGLLKIAAAHPGSTLTYFGDTGDDARSARAAQVPFVGVAHGNNPRRPELVRLLEAEGAVAVIEDINELEKVLSCAKPA
jgi:HAD superfamily hydrolase (TIGR01548 family)